MTSKATNGRKKAALVLIGLAPLIAVFPMIVAWIGIRIDPECTLAPNCPTGAFAFLVLLTVPIGLVLLVVGLIMLLTGKSKKGPIQ